MPITPPPQHLTPDDIQEIRLGLSEIRQESQPELGPLTQKQFAKIAGNVHPISVARWECGLRSPAIYYRRILLRHFETVSRYRARKQLQEQKEKIL